MEYRVERLDEHTWLIEEYDDVISVYMYLLEGEKEAVLIDTGMGTLPLDKICAELTDKPITVLLTHGHVDHIGGTYLFDKVYLHPADRDTYTLHSGDIRKLFYKGYLPDVKKDLLFFEEKQVFDLGGRILEVVETPGHTVGSVCFLDPERKWLFTGDTCCKAHVLLQMDYSTDLKVFLRSIQSLEQREEEFTVTWPGHHAKPVAPSILKQYEIAAEGLLGHTMEGKDFIAAGPGVKLLEYMDIGIEYNPDLWKE